MRPTPTSRHIDTELKTTPGGFGAIAPKPLPLATLAFVTLGCASVTQSMQAPSIELTAVKLIEAGLNKQSFALDFTADNPNALPIPVSSIHYALTLAGQSFAEGQSAQSFTLPARGSGDFRVEVNTDLMRSARALSQIVFAGGQRELEYHLNGDFKVNLPFTRAVPFSNTGVVRLER